MKVENLKKYQNYLIPLVISFIGFWLFRCRFSGLINESFRSLRRVDERLELLVLGLLFLTYAFVWILIPTLIVRTITTKKNYFSPLRKLVAVAVLISIIFFGLFVLTELEITGLKPCQGAPEDGMQFIPNKYECSLQGIELVAYASPIGNYTDMVGKTVNYPTQPQGNNLLCVAYNEFTENGDEVASCIIGKENNVKLEIVQDGINFYCIVGPKGGF